MEHVQGHTADGILGWSWVQARLNALGVPVRTSAVAKFRGGATLDHATATLNWCSNLDRKDVYRRI